MSDHYFSASPGSDLRRVPVRVRAWGHELDLVSSSGVFSHGRLDVATSMLFRSAEPASDGTLLDLGCGYGVIAVALAKAAPQARVWAVDVNERALQLTVENLDRMGAQERVQVALPEAVDEAVTFDEIWSNPPIRIGKPALHELLLRWLPRLKPDGRAVMVVGKNLGADSLQTWLRGRGYSCERLASAKGFRVLDVRKP